MNELSPEGGSEGYGAGSDEAAAPVWSSWKARSFPAWLVCWTWSKEGIAFPPFPLFSTIAEHFSAKMRLNA